VDLKINLGVEYKDLSNETFKYTVSVMPSPGGQPLNSSTTSSVLFTESTASGCQAGRLIGSTPTVTDTRYEETSILIVTDEVNLQKYSSRIPGEEANGLLTFSLVKIPSA